MAVSLCVTNGRGEDCFWVSSFGPWPPGTADKGNEPAEKGAGQKKSRFCVHKTTLIILVGCVQLQQSWNWVVVGWWGAVADPLADLAGVWDFTSSPGSGDAGRSESRGSGWPIGWRRRRRGEMEDDREWVAIIRSTPYY